MQTLLRQPGPQDLDVRYRRDVACSRDQLGVGMALVELGDGCIEFCLGAGDKDHRVGVRFCKGVGDIESDTFRASRDKDRSAHLAVCRRGDAGIARSPVGRGEIGHVGGWRPDEM